MPYCFNCDYELTEQEEIITDYEDVGDNRLSETQYTCNECNTEYYVRSLKERR